MLFSRSPRRYHAGLILLSSFDDGGTGVDYARGRAGPFGPRPLVQWVQTRRSAPVRCVTAQA